MKILDTHLHTQEASEDSHLPLRDAVARARSLGLAGICVTDHESMRLRPEARALSRELDFPVFVGIEVLTTAGDFVVFGLDREPTSIPSALELMRAAACCGGATVAVHPFRKSGRGAQEATLTLPFLNGIEGFNGGTKPEENLRALAAARARNLACLGGSDAHDAGQVGKFATEFLGEVRDENDIIRLIRAGACRPVAWDGARYVPAEDWTRQELKGAGDR